MSNSVVAGLSLLLACVVPLANADFLVAHGSQNGGASPTPFGGPSPAARYTTPDQLYALRPYGSRGTQGLTDGAFDRLVNPPPADLLDVLPAFSNTIASKVALTRALTEGELKPAFAQDHLDNGSVQSYTLWPETHRIKVTLANATGR
jgi:hypothetical protein